MSNEKQLTPMREMHYNILQELVDVRFEMAENPNAQDLSRLGNTLKRLEEVSKSLLPKEEESHIQMHLKGQRSMHGGGSRIWAESAFNETFKTESDEK